MPGELDRSVLGETRTARRGISPTVYSVVGFAKGSDPSRDYYCPRPRYTIYAMQIVAPVAIFLLFQVSR